MSQRFCEPKSLNLPQTEVEIRQFWKAESIFERSLEARADSPNFSFYEGPPTANGRPGIHHVLGRTVKDVFCRYKTMQGFRVDRKGGWDTHGLPVEIEVEKALGLKSRAEVEAYGIEPYNRACRESVLKYKKDWDELTEQIGYWVDLDAPYITFDNHYIESVWWLVSQIHAKGLLYKGHKIQWYSPGSGTVLSSHEVSLGYKEVQDPSVYVRFPVPDSEMARLPGDAASPAGGVFLLAWTTTPWTLPSNVALAVGLDIEYVRVARRNDNGEIEHLILAEARLEALREEVEILAHCRGADLLDLRYRPLFDLATAHVVRGELQSAYRLIPGDFVTTEDGTGIVHIAPAFGADDYEVARQNDLPMINPVQPNGEFAPGLDLVGGGWFKDADKVLARDLRERGLLFRHDTYMHNYPFDWRKGTPLMSYPVESWFVRTTEVRDRMVSLNREINWHPPAIRDGRFGNWLENNVDWALSRKRFWGTPLPIWVSDCEGSDYFEVIDSIETLRHKVGAACPDDARLDLHRPFVDELTWPAPDGGTMRRVPDVLDVWFDSGAMPFAQWHFPFENREKFERNFPADFIAEGLDQTRGWFYTLHAIATVVKDQSAYRNVVVNGLILDENGEKMSKSRGNTVDPFTTVAEYGADVVRWYMISNSPPWESMRFSERGLIDTRRRFFSTLENVYAFFASYANIDGFVYAEEALPIAERSELDRWILSQANSLAERTGAAFDAYDATTAARDVEAFVDAFSNWYIRRSRRRFWREARGGTVGADNRDKLAAYQTTFECLATTARLMAPIAPFFSEWLFRSLDEVTGREAVPSVHMADFPVADRSAIDRALEARMGLARTMVSLALLLRNRHRINVRQPLSRVLVVLNESVTREQVEAIVPIVLEEINVLEVEFIEDSAEVVKRSIKPDFKKLGPRLGKHMGRVAGWLKGLSEAEVQAFASNGEISTELDGETVTVMREEVEFISEEVGDWVVAQEDAVTVALDLQITPALKLQGLAREAVNRIQHLRKEADLNLADRITLQVAAEGELAEAIAEHKNWIANEVLAHEIAMVASPTGQASEQFEIDGASLTVALSVVGSL